MAIEHSFMNKSYINVFDIHCCAKGFGSRYKVSLMWYYKCGDTSSNFTKNNDHFLHYKTF